ncbi:hypothetical protein J6590_037449 [Homalodisca vitripennis]|nr:hypothetical protein J6590_037449 [Homalodisca vitripennis]
MAASRVCLRVHKWVTQSIQYTQKCPRMESKVAVKERETRVQEAHSSVAYSITTYVSSNNTM